MAIDYTNDYIFAGHFNGDVEVYKFTSKNFERIWTDESSEGRTIYDGKMCPDESFVFTMELGGSFSKKVFRADGNGGF